MGYASGAMEADTFPAVPLTCVCAADAVSVTHLSSSSLP